MSVPVTLIAGFLGSGKTTLVRRLLQESHGVRCAVVVNEFGALGIDGSLVVQRAAEDSSVVELSNGCICCEIQDDLRATLLELVRRGSGASASGTAITWLRRALGGGSAADGGFDRILVEASGAASPGPAVQTFLIDDELSRQVHLDGVVTLAHAARVREQLDGTREAADQLAYADRVVVNHADRVDADELEAVAAHVRACNPLADVRTAEHAAVRLDWVFSAPRAEAADALWKGVDAAGTSHTEGLVSVSLTAGAPLDRAALLMWLEFLAKRRGQELMRAKGILRVQGASSALVVQGVYQWLEAVEEDAPAPEVSRLVLIGRDLDRDEIARGWAAIGGDAAAVG
ncbi:MAG: GTP-binding protein [Planctomycetota bacterium]